MTVYSTTQGLPSWLSGKESAGQCRRCRKHWFNPWVTEIPWSRKWQPMPVFLPGKVHGQRHLASYSPWGCQESDTTEHVCSSSSPGTLGPKALSAGPRLRGRGPARTSSVTGTSAAQPCLSITGWRRLEPSDRQGKPCAFDVLASSVPILCPTCSQPQLQSATSWLHLICPRLPILLYFLSLSSGKSWFFCLFIFYDLFFDHVMLGMWDLSSLRRD